MPKKASSTKTVTPQLTSETTSIVFKKIARKRKKKSDGAYVPGMSPSRKKKKNHNRNPMTFRFDTSTTITDTTGKEIPLKNAVIINPTFFDNNPDFKKDQSPLLKKFNNSISDIKTNRPIQRVIEKSKNGSPISIITPYNTKLKRCLTLGPLSLFTSNPTLREEPVPTVTQINPSADFFTSEQFKAIKKAVDRYKENSMEIDLDLIKEAEKQHEKNGYRRKISQNQVMLNKGHKSKYGSATLYAKATDIVELDIPQNWFHLLMHYLKGLASQVESNLASGSAHANTLMMVPEYKYKDIASYYPTFKLTVKSELIPGTQIATMVTVTISTPKNISPHFEMPIYINGQTNQKPHISTNEYFAKWIKTIGEYAKEQQEYQAKSTKKSLNFND